MKESGETLDGFFRRRHKDLKNRHKRFGDAADPITKDELIALYLAQNGVCAITGLPMHATSKHKDLSASPDRIDNTQGYQKDNVRLVCARANLMRSNLDDHDFVWWCRAVIDTNDRRQKIS